MRQTCLTTWCENMPPARIHTGKRQHIVETAYVLFKRVGYHATGIDRIIAESNVAKMTMYRHFPGKDGLIVEVLQYRARRFDAQLDRLAEKATTPQQKIGKIFDWYERWFQSDDFHGCLFRACPGRIRRSGTSGVQGRRRAQERLQAADAAHSRGDDARRPGRERRRRAFHAAGRGDPVGSDGTGRQAIRDARKAGSSILAMPDALQ